MYSPNSTMSRTASRTTRSMVLLSSGVSRSLVVLFSLGCYMQEYRRQPGDTIQRKDGQLTASTAEPPVMDMLSTHIVYITMLQYMRGKHRALDC